MEKAFSSAVMLGLIIALACILLVPSEHTSDQQVSSQELEIPVSVSNITFTRETGNAGEVTVPYVDCTNAVGHLWAHRPIVMRYVDTALLVAAQSKRQQLAGSLHLNKDGSPAYVDYVH